MCITPAACAFGFTTHATSPLDMQLSSLGPHPLPHHIPLYLASLLFVIPVHSLLVYPSRLLYALCQPFLCISFIWALVISHLRHTHSLGHSLYLLCLPYIASLARLAIPFAILTPSSVYIAHVSVLDCQFKYQVSHLSTRLLTLCLGPSTVFQHLWIRLFCCHQADRTPAFLIHIFRCRIVRYASFAAVSVVPCSTHLPFRCRSGPILRNASALCPRWPS